MTLISVRNLKKDYMLGSTVVHAVRGIDLTIEKGDFVSIVGPSGSGKTTLLNIIGCVDQATSGKVILNKQDISKLNDNQLTDLRLFNIGFIFQSFNLIPVLNVIENIEFPLLMMKKFTRQEIRERAEYMIKQVKIADQRFHRPYELSGGQRQRVAIARALVTHPQIVLADEPTANLDSQTGETILELMKHLNEKHKTTFVFSTHDPDVLKYASEVVKLKDGKIVC